MFYITCVRASLIKNRESFQIISVGSEVGQQVGPGKRVLFSDVSAYEVDLGTDARHCFCKESDLLALVE